MERREWNSLALVVAITGVLLFSSFITGAQAEKTAKPLSPSSVVLGVSFSISPDQIVLGQQTTFNGLTWNGQGSNYAYAYSGQPPGCPGSGITLGSWADQCTPTASGNYTINVEVTDGKGNWGYSSAELTVVPQLVLVSFAATPSTIILNSSTQFSVSVTGGVAPYKYNFTGLPPGCKTANSSILSCTPTTTGSFSPWVHVNDSFGQSVNSSTNLMINPPPPTLSSVEISPATAALASGGTQTFTSIPACSAICPPGISYSWNITDGAMGSLNGTGASMNFTAGSTVGTVGLFVNATLNGITMQSSPALISTTGPPLLSVSVSPATASMTSGGNQTFSAATKCSGGTCPAGTTYDWTMTQFLGTLSSTTGASVKFTAGSQVGNDTLFVNATLNGVTRQSAPTYIAITAIPMPKITSFSVTPSAVVVDSWTNFTVSASGGEGKLGYAYAGLPKGCSSADLTILSCRPTQTGSYDVRVWANDTAEHSASATTPLEVKPHPLVVLLSANRTELYAGGSITLRISISGGIGPYSGTLSINGTNSTHTGTTWNLTIAYPGNYTYVGWVTDAKGVVASSPAVKVRVNLGVSSTTPVKTGSQGYPWWLDLVVLLVVACALVAMILIVLARRRRSIRDKIPPGTGVAAIPPPASAPATGAVVITSTSPVTPETQMEVPVPAPAKPAEWDESNVERSPAEEKVQPFEQEKPRPRPKKSQSSRKRKRDT